MTIDLITSIRNFSMTMKLCRPIQVQISPSCRTHVDNCEKTRGRAGNLRVKSEKTTQRQSCQTNWQSPFLWSQIELVAVKARKPWHPCEILKEARKIDCVVFASLTEQVIGRWIDPEGKHRGLSRWTDAVLERVCSGNSLDGQTTRRGILVC